MFVMKLHAFRDEHAGKKGADREDYARKHARDLFTLTALLTLDEYNALPDFHERHGTHLAAQEAAQIVSAYFGDATAPGLLRLREAEGNLDPEDIEKLIGLLKATFPF